MNPQEPKFIVEIYKNEEKSFEISSEKMIKVEEIKKKCQEKYKHQNKDLNNIYLWFIDEDSDKNLIIGNIIIIMI